MAVTLDRKTRQKTDAVSIATKGNITTYEECDSGIRTKIKVRHS